MVGWDLLETAREDYDDRQLARAKAFTAFLSGRGVSSSRCGSSEMRPVDASLINLRRNAPLDRNSPISTRIGSSLRGTGLDFAAMFVTRNLLQACRITLFSRDNCGLCSQAKGVLSNVWDKRPFDYKEVDLAKPEWTSWKDIYDFDIPVVSRTMPLKQPLTWHVADARARFTSAKPMALEKLWPPWAKPSN